MSTSLTVIVLIPIIMITTEKAYSIFFSISFYTIFFLNMTCLPDIYFGILPTPPSKIKWSVPNYQRPLYSTKPIKW